MSRRAIAVATLLVCSIELRAQEPQPSSQPPIEIEEKVVVTSTRTGGRIDDQPTRVEILEREEIEEKLMMTPGDIVMMLNEMGGLRVQATSSATGAASVRIQGMQGRYTRVLFDGLPLAGQQVGGLGLLQIPPMDLGHVEVIKGVASALYGAGAMGGVINLVSRRPGADPFAEVLFNQSTIGTTDGVGFLARTLAAGVSGSLLAGLHHQVKNDVDDDDWFDVAGYTRGVIRPRAFWDDGKGSSGSATIGVTSEFREGGPRDGSALSQKTGGAESIKTVRADAGAVIQRVVGDRYLVSGRAGASFQEHDHLYYTVRERDQHTNIFAEMSLRGSAGKHTWVGGLAYESDSLDPRDVERFKYAHRVPGFFVQDDLQWLDWLSVSAGARLDAHSVYGNFFSPRVAALVRWRGWTSRVAAGAGFYASSPLTEETDAAGLTRLSMPAPLEAEQGDSFSADVSRTIGAVTATLTMFASSVDHPLQVEREGTYAIYNAVEPSSIRGLELLATYRHAPFTVTGNYTALRAREHRNGLVAEPSLTPAHSVSLVGMWEKEGLGRLGVEYYFTGEQRLDDNPYRQRSAAYSIVGVLAERQFARYRVFVNAENLTGVRQSAYDPVVRPSQAADGRWSVDAWSPLDGRTLNGGVRLRF